MLHQHYYNAPYHFNATPDGLISLSKSERVQDAISYLSIQKRKEVLEIYIKSAHPTVKRDLLLSGFQLDRELRNAEDPDYMEIFTATGINKIREALALIHQVQPIPTEIQTQINDNLPVNNKLSFSAVPG